MHFDPAPEAHNAGLLARNSEECTLQSWRKCARTAVSLCEAARYFIRIWLLSTCIIDYRQPQPQFLGIRKTGVYGLILVFQEIRAMVWRPNMLPCNSSAWQHWKQHNAQRKAQRRLEKLQQSEVLYRWKFHRQTWRFHHAQLLGCVKHSFISIPKTRSNKNDDPEWLWYALGGTVETTNQPSYRQYTQTHIVDLCQAASLAAAAGGSQARKASRSTSSGDMFSSSVFPSIDVTSTFLTSAIDVTCEGSCR